MKTALSAIAAVAALTLTPCLGGSFAVADNSAQRQEHGVRFSPEDRAAFLDARIAALKAGLALNSEQEKNWPPLESAMRDLAKQRAVRFAAWKARREANQDEENQDATSKLVQSIALPAPLNCSMPAPPICKNWRLRPSPFTTAWTTARSAGSLCFSVERWVAGRAITGAATAEPPPALGV